jgi:hypothetical protein
MGNLGYLRLSRDQIADAAVQDREVQAALSSRTGPNLDRSASSSDISTKSEPRRSERRAGATTSGLSLMAANSRYAAGCEIRTGMPLMA